MFAIPTKERSAENVVQAHLSGIFAHKLGSIVIPIDNGTELKNTVLNETFKQLCIKRLFSIPFHPQGNSGIDSVDNFLKRTLAKFLECSESEWDELLPFVCYCYNIIPSSNGTKLAF